MAVYTDVAAEDLTRFLSSYDIGELLSYKGIAEGVENSNFLVHTGAGNFILTLYEKRVAEGDLPFFLGLMEHLAARGITCPQPVKNKQGGMLGKIAGRPAAIVTFLDGLWIRRPNPVTAPRSAKRWRNCILRARTSSSSARTPCRSKAGVRCMSTRSRVATASAPAFAAKSPRSSMRWKNHGRANCRKA